jgi:hypothetical protein
MVRTKFYQASADSPVSMNYAGLVIKTDALAIPLRSAMASFMGSVFAAFIFGSVARGTGNHGGVQPC